MWNEDFLRLFREKKKRGRTQLLGFYLFFLRMQFAGGMLLIREQLRLLRAEIFTSQYQDRRTWEDDDRSQHKDLYVFLGWDPYPRDSPIFSSPLDSYTPLPGAET